MKNLLKYRLLYFERGQRGRVTRYSSNHERVETLERAHRNANLASCFSFMIADLTVPRPDRPLTRS